MLPELLPRPSGQPFVKVVLTRAPAATSCSPVTRGATTARSSTATSTTTSTSTTPSGSGWCRNEHMPSFFAPHVWREVSDVDTVDIFRDVLPDAEPPGSPEEYVNHSLYFEAKTFLHGLLVVEDKLAWRTASRRRVPFLDNDLVDFAHAPAGAPQTARPRRGRALNENEPGPKTERYFERPAMASSSCAAMGATSPRSSPTGQAGILGTGRELVPRRQHRVCARPADRRRGDLRVPRPGPSARWSRTTSPGARTAACCSGRC